MVDGLQCIYSVSERASSSWPSSVASGWKSTEVLKKFPETRLELCCFSCWSVDFTNVRVHLVMTPIELKHLHYRAESWLTYRVESRFGDTSGVEVEWGCGRRRETSDGIWQEQAVFPRWSCQATPLTKRGKQVSWRLCECHKTRIQIYVTWGEVKTSNSYSQNTFQGESF